LISRKTGPPPLWALRRVDWIRAVEAEDRVEVDQAASLKLGHLGK
jgi:hypothetical protein